MPPETGDRGKLAQDEAVDAATACPAPATHYKDSPFESANEGMRNSGYVFL